MREKMICGCRTDDIKEDDDKLDIIWQNLLVSDRIHNLQLFSSAAFAWLLYYCERTETGYINAKNYQDLEKELRDKNMNTYLIANERELHDERQCFGLPLIEGHTRNKKYECLFSCRPPPYAMRELLQYQKSYEENFEKLRDCGSIFVNEENLNPPEEVEYQKSHGHEFVKMNEKEMNLSQLIQQSKKKLVCIYFDV